MMGGGKPAARQAEAQVPPSRWATREELKLDWASNSVLDGVRPRLFATRFSSSLSCWSSYLFLDFAESKPAEARAFVQPLKRFATVTAATSLCASNSAMEGMSATRRAI